MDCLFFEYLSEVVTRNYESLKLQITRLIHCNKYYFIRLERHIIRIETESVLIINNMHDSVDSLTPRIKAAHTHEKPKLYYTLKQYNTASLFV